MAGIMENSWETEKLEKLIEEKKKDFQRPKPDFAQKKLQEEILFLENEILPIVEKETVLLYSEITKHLTAKIKEAIKQDANAIVMIIPLTESHDNTMRIATVNPHRDNPIEGVEIAVESDERTIEEIKL